MKKLQLWEMNAEQKVVEHARLGQVARSRKLLQEAKKHERVAKQREATILRYKERDLKWEGDMFAYTTDTLPANWQRIGGTNVLPSRPICRDKTFKRWQGPVACMLQDDPEDDIGAPELAVAAIEMEAMIDFKRREDVKDIEIEKEIEIETLGYCAKQTFNMKAARGYSVLGDEDSRHLFARKVRRGLRTPEVTTMRRVHTAKPVPADAPTVTETKSEEMRRPRRRNNLGPTGIKLADYVANATREKTR